VNPLLPNGEQDLEAMLAMCRETALRLKAAGQDRALIVEAIDKFLDFGDAGEYSQPELWDYFGGQTMESADPDEQSRDRLLRIFSTCTRERYGDGRPDPPDWPWHEQDPKDVQTERVLYLVDDLSKRKGSLGMAVVMLAASMALFVGAGAAIGDWSFVIMVVPILLFHEVGHWIAMKVFGYRNLRMFFIPFFGAGVTGQAYNVEGWKKAVVALAGPLPGIALAVGVGGVGYATKQMPMISFALLTVIVNGINLVPLFPLDGGRVLHAVVFARHPLVDVVFRGVAAAGLAGSWFLVGDWFLAVLGVVLLLGLPSQYAIARVTADLRRQRLPMAPTAEHIIPRETGRTIIESLRDRLSQSNIDERTLARRTLNVFESLSSDPPGWLGSLLILTTYGVGVAVSLGLGIVLMGVRQGLIAM
jgi:Zn-dependent protease